VAPIKIETTAPSQAINEIIKADLTHDSINQGSKQVF